MKDVITIMARVRRILWDAPTARALAVQELEEAKRQFLRNQSAAEYHTQMNAMFRAKILRLETFIKGEGD